MSVQANWLLPLGLGLVLSLVTYFRLGGRKPAPVKAKRDHRPRRRQ